MHAQGIPALLSLSLTAAAFLVGTTGASAQPPKSPSNGLDGSQQLASAGAFPAPVVSAGLPVVSVVDRKSETTRIEPALMAFEEMLKRHRTAGNLEGEAEALAAIASSYRVLKQEQKALDYLQSALALWRDLRSDNEQASTIAQIGDVYREWGFPDQANRFYRQALKIYSRTSDRQGEAVTRNNSGVAYLTLKDRKKCLDNLQGALTLYQTNHDPHGEAVALSNLGAASMFFSSKDPERAVGELQQVLAKLLPLDDLAAEANVLDMIGVTFSRLNRAQMAEQSFHRALALYHSLGDAEGESAVSGNIKQLGDSGSYRVHQVAAVSRATPEPLRPTAAQLRVFEILSPH